MMNPWNPGLDGNIHAIKVNALIVPSLQQDLIGGTNNLDFQVILDQDPNVAEIHPLLPYGDEQSIPFISDDLHLFQTKASHMANAAKVSRQPLNDATKKQLFYTSTHGARRSGNPMVEIVTGKEGGMYSLEDICSV